VTPIHILYEEAQKEAAALNLAVAGSEIVGVVPLESMLMAADYYIEKENLFIYQEEQKIRLAIERMGLNSISAFNPKEKIIEYIVAEEPSEPLASMSVRGFIEEIAARTSAPGGGSSSAAIAAIGTGLGSMVAKLTWGVRKFEEVQPHMIQAIPVLHELTVDLIPMIDADTSAFNEYMEGLKMPRSTDEEKSVRTAKMQSGLRTAIQIPLKTMRFGDQAWDALCIVAQYGNPASRSDTQVGAKALETGIWGAYQNVLINMEGIHDQDYKREILAEAMKIMQRAKAKCSEVLAILDTQET
jgi:glutamate formiminotransferase/formiminotetrahydrofolate cyclodeaminase